MIMSLGQCIGAQNALSQATAELGPDTHAPPYRKMLPHRRAEAVLSPIR